MKVCVDKIVAAHPKADPKIIENLVNEISETPRLPNGSLNIIAKKHGATETLLRDVLSTMQDQMVIKKVIDLKARAEQPNYAGAKGVRKFITDIFASSVEAVQGGSLSISALKEQYARKYAHSLDMALLDIDKRSISMLKNMGPAESAKLLKAIKGTASGDPLIDDIAAAIRTANDALYADKASKGFMVTYREDYGFRRFYDGDKITNAGFKQFATDILNDLDMSKSKIEGITKENVGQILELINKNASEEEFIKASKTNQLLAAIKDDMDNWVAEYDPYDVGTSTKMYASTGRQSSRKQRSYIFKNEDTEMHFMKDYGLYGSDVLSYVQTDMRRSAGELAFGEMFGPKMRNGFDTFLDEMKAKVIASGATNAEADNIIRDAQRMYAYASGSITRAPIDGKTAVELGAKGVVSYGADALINLTNSGVLATSAITQLLDIPQSYYAYMFKNKQSLIIKIPKLLGHTMGAAIDAMRKDHSLRKYGEHVTDLAVKVLGEIDAASQKRHWTSKGLDFVLTHVGVNYMNRMSSILNLRLLGDMLKNPKYLANAEKILGRYNLTPDDLDFASGLFQRMSHMDLTRLPDSFFDANPRGVSGEVYKKQVADKFSMFLRENMRHGAATKGFRENLQLSFGTDFTNQLDVGSSIIRMVTQLKGIPRNLLNSTKYIANNYPVTSNPYANGVVHMAANIGIVSTAYMGLQYLRYYIQNDFDEDKAYEKLTKGKGLGAAYVSSILRSSALSLYLEPFGSAMYNEDWLSAAAGTPSAKIVLSTGKLLGKFADQIPNILDPNAEMDEVLDKRMSKEIYRNYSNAVPFANLRYYLPFIDAGEDIDKAIIEAIDSLDE